MKSVVPVLAVSLVACVQQEVTRPVPLASLPDLHLQIWASAKELVVGMNYDDSVSGCGSLSSSFEATVAGTAVPIETAGALDEGLCSHPVLRLTSPPASAPAQLVLGDDSLTVTVELDDALLPRSATFEPQAPLQQDQSIAVTWSPVSDLAKYKPEVWLLESDQVWFFDSTVANDLLQFTVVPNRPLVAGGAALQIKMTQQLPAPFSCTNATCELVTDRSVTQPVVVQ